MLDLTPSNSYSKDLLVKNDILSTLAYFDIFNYPLKEKEIWFFLPGTHTIAEFEAGLQALTDSALICRHDEFYSLQSNYAIAHRRRKGNEKAQQLLQTAKKVASFLSKFPFVRGVAVSGSLSKNFADDTSDIDLFIITSKNRLWLARTFLHCFKKLTFLFNKQHYFCMNYFIEEDHLEIAEKNIFTATEIATLLPLQGTEAFEKFYAANTWTKNFLPNKYLRISTEKQLEPLWLKWSLEKLFSNPIGIAMDRIFMTITASRWKRKTKAGKLNARGIVMQMAASRYCAKPVAKNFQAKLIEQYERKAFELLNKKVVAMKTAE